MALSCDEAQGGVFMRKIHPFHGGIHPPEHKIDSTQQPILTLPLPSQLIVPLRQSMGSIPKCLVKKGEYVKKGQKIAEAQGRVSVCIHAPTSGIVADINEQVVAHPSGLKEACVVIIPDGCDEWISQEPVDFSQWAEYEVRHYLQQMGVVGLGGAVFPSHLKLKQGLETLVINGAECEPYITCDDMLMRERADDIVAGIAILHKLLRPNEILIGIEDNKPEAIAALRLACENQGNIAEVVVVPTCYPSGGARQLIKLLTNKEVPSGIRSIEMGVQCFNVATVYTIYRALTFAEPVLSRIVTVTGNVHAAANYDVLIGTPLDEVVWRAAPKDDTDGYIMGGPMMGFRVPAWDVPISKASNCFIATSPTLFPVPKPALPCIRCGQCATVCPVQLQPQDLYWFAKSKNMGKAQERALFDCIECGACAYVCPSKLPLVDYYRFAKSEIWAAEAQKKSADQARERHEFRLLRIAREKAEKAARLAAKAAAKQEIVAELDEPQAVERAAKIKTVEAATHQAQETNVSVLREEEQAAQRRAKIQAALARATEKKAQAELAVSHSEKQSVSTTAFEQITVEPDLSFIPTEGDKALDSLDAEKIRHISQKLRNTTNATHNINSALVDKSEQE
jgi:electron transport complex protein RnfC